MRNIAQRHKFIIEQLQQEGYVSVQTLSQELGVSEVTIRKDLKHLESMDMLSRSHGSASNLIPVTKEMHIDEKEKIFIDEKTRIARAAAQLLQPRDKIIIASGTTLLTFAREINTDNILTVLTSSVKVSLALCYKPNIDIIQLGGSIRKSSVSVIGYYAENILRVFSCNKLFLGVDGIDMDYGLTTSDMNEAHINQQMIKSAQKVIVMTDSSKFGKRGFSKICDCNQIHHIITDKNIPDHYVRMFQEKNIEITIV